MMPALYLDNAGTKCFEVVHLLMSDYGTSSADARMILIGVRVRLMVRLGLEMQELKDKLEELGARTVIDLGPDIEIEKVRPDIEIGSQSEADAFSPNPGTSLDY